MRETRLRQAQVRISPLNYPGREDMSFTKFKSMALASLVCSLAAPGREEHYLGGAVTRGLPAQAARQPPILPASCRPDLSRAPAYTYDQTNEVIESGGSTTFKA